MWKEPAEIQFAAMVKSLETANLNIGNMCSVSRDNPNVNKKLVSLVDQYIKDKNYIKLLDVGVCALHPTHTSFRKALDELETDVWSLAVDLHSFFKISTSRREDIIKFSLFLKMKLICSFFDQLTLVGFQHSQYLRGLPISGKLSPSTFVLL